MRVAKWLVKKISVALLMGALMSIYMAAFYSGGDISDYCAPTHQIAQEQSDIVHAGGFGGLEFFKNHSGKKIEVHFVQEGSTSYIIGASEWMYRYWPCAPKKSFLYDLLGVCLHWCLLFLALFGVEALFRWVEPEYYKKPERSEKES